MSDHLSERAQVDAFGAECRLPDLADLGDERTHSVGLGRGQLSNVFDVTFGFEDEPSGQGYRAQGVLEDPERIVVDDPARRPHFACDGRARQASLGHGVNAGGE